MSEPKRKVSELGAGVELEKFQNMLKEATVAHIAISQQKAHLSDIAERAKDELGIASAEFNRYAKVAYESEKAREALDKAEELYEQSVRLGLIYDHD